LARVAPLNEARLVRLPPNDLSDFKRSMNGWLCGISDLTPKQLKSIVEPLCRMARQSHQARFFK
jgi:hypothetical protein